MAWALRSCPFCGGDAKMYSRSNKDSPYSGWLCFEVDNWIACHGDCGATTAMHETEEDAVTMWNRRP